MEKTENYNEKTIGVEISDEPSLDSDSIANEKYIATEYTVEERERIANFIANSESMKDLLEHDFEYILSVLPKMNVERGLEIIKEALEEHSEDVNFPNVMLEDLRAVIKGQEESGYDEEFYELDVCLQACILRYHSPYPEVRAVVPPTDDYDMPCETIRAYIIGIFWVGCGSFINEMFHQRQPSIILTATVFQILVYPSGKFLARILPNYRFKFGKSYIDLSPGSWTFKEQMFATIMTNVGAGSTNFFHYGLTMRLPIFFNQTYAKFGFMFLMAFVTNFFGFGLAGVLRRYAVYPTKALWPTVLPILQLNKTLLLPETKTSTNGWTISKYKFFWLLFIGSFVYFFLPDYLFTALSTFNWMTWIAPQNKNLAFITGQKMGLGFNPWPTFDWSVINYTTPLIVPFFSMANRFAGVVLGGLVVIGMYYSNYKYTGYFPPNNSSVYDRYGNKYNTTRVIVDGEFNADLYKEYSQVYISAGNLESLGAYYAMYSIAFTYVMLNEWRIVWNACKGLVSSFKNRKLSNYDQFPDVHSTMMRRYQEVPDWWFLIVIAVSIGVGAGAICGYPTHTPFWAVIVVILVSIALVIPVVLVFAQTGYLIPCDTLTVIIAAYMVPGRATASLICRVFGYNTDEQAESFISDQKIGHYAKIPPRAVFRGQMIATLLQCFITTAAVIWLIDNNPDLCTSTQSARLVCTFPNQLYSNTLLLGVVGPKRTYDVIYPLLKWAFLLGGIVGTSFYFLRRWFPQYLKYFHPVVFMSGMNRFGATYNVAYFTPGFYCSFVFMYFIRKRYLAWWTKYNYILSSGLTAGMAYSGILIFFALQYTKKTVTWWGTSVSSAGVDGGGVATRLTAPVEGFGPEIGSWS
ncbi:OPT oligopeptide transporter protein-domain-containing protein [Lipomyces oligophaga]|uniref:OPT oligopeptide transporter protein-domain-containing protein n=1 Tax=Lipomyces oligophaga TaxID=45792 RepID=UPI0034CE2E5A